MRNCFTIQKYALNSFAGSTWSYLYDFSSGVINLYGVNFITEDSLPERVQFQSTVTGNLYKVTFTSPYEIDFWGSGITINDVTGMGGGSFSFDIRSSSPLTLTNCKVYGAPTAVTESLGSTRSNCHTFANLLTQDTTTDFQLYHPGLGIKLLDPLFTPISSKLRAYCNNGFTYTIWIDYTMSINVIDVFGSAIQNVSVILKNKNSVQQFSLSTDSSGNITPTSVNVKAWIHIHNTSSATIIYQDSEITDYNPFELWVSKSGYETYYSKFTLNNTTKNMCIKLRRSKSPGRDNKGPEFR